MTKIEYEVGDKIERDSWMFIVDSKQLCDTCEWYEYFIIHEDFYKKVQEWAPYDEYIKANYEWKMMVIRMVEK